MIFPTNTSVATEKRKKIVACKEIVPYRSLHSFLLASFVFVVVFLSRSGSFVIEKAAQNLKASMDTKLEFSCTSQKQGTLKWLTAMRVKLSLVFEW